MKTILRHLVLGFLGISFLAAEEPAKLPLSQGILISTLESGGIAGLHNVTLVTEDWRLVVTGRARDSVRQLDAEERKNLQAVLKRFSHAKWERSDGPNVADGMKHTLVARGSGEGEADATEVILLRQMLMLLTKSPPKER